MGGEETLYADGVMRQTVVYLHDILPLMLDLDSKTSTQRCFPSILHSPFIHVLSLHLQWTILCLRAASSIHQPCSSSLNLVRGSFL